VCDEWFQRGTPYHRLDAVMITEDNARTAAAIAVSIRRDHAQSDAGWCGHGVQLGVGGDEFAALATLHKMIGATVRSDGRASLR
jgi:magnesium-transporting ATPase (P-type)